MLSEVKAVDKTIELITTQTGFLRNSSSVINPVIKFSNIEQYIGSVNYAYIEEFGRYYFITNTETISTGIWVLSFHVDVLYTYRDAIRANYGIVYRNQNQYDLLLNDGLFQTQQNPRIGTYSFPSGFTTTDFVLAIAGNS